LILLAVALLIFGTKKLKNIDGDSGSAMKNFKPEVQDDGKNNNQQNKTIALSKNAK
jgi:sec-independent protein translocase protein TatA